MKIPGVYVEIKGDATLLKKEMTAARQIVVESAKGMSNALNNALSPGQISGNVNKLVANLGQLSRTSKVTSQDFKLIGVDLKELQRLTGITGAAFQTLQSKMMATQAAKAQEKALKDIATAANLTEKEIRELGQQFGLTNAQIKNVSGGSQQASSSMTMLGGAVRMALAYLSVTQVYEFGKAVLDTGIKVDSLQRSFVAITGSTAGMESEFAFMRKTAADTGQNMYALADSYRQLTASTQGTILEGQKTRDLFQSMSEASAVLGLSNERVELSMKAFAQMAAKGVVQMEELKNQLGDSLPGAVNIAAKAMGITQAALMKMSAEGKLLATDLLPKMSAELHKMYGEAAQTAALDSGQAAVNRLSQAWTDFKANLYDNKKAVASINMVTSALEAMTGAMDASENRMADLKRQLASMPVPKTSMLGGDTGFGGDDELQKRRAALSQELGELVAHKEAKLAIDGAYAVGREAIAAEAAAKIEAARSKEYDANRAHKDQEYQYYIQQVTDEQAAEVQAYDEGQKEKIGIVKTGAKAELKEYNALAADRARLSEEVTDALAKEGMTQTEQAKYELDKQYAADLELAGNDMALASKVTAHYLAELKKREKQSTSWQDFQNRQLVESTTKYKMGWEVAAEGRKDADEQANKELVEGANNTTNAMAEGFSRFADDAEGYMADLALGAEFSFDTILDMLKRMLAEMLAAILMSGIKAALLDMWNTGSMSGASSAFMSGISGAMGSGSGGSGGTVDASGAASGWGKVGGGLAVAGGAYGMYSGAQNMKNGNTGAGAVQMGLGAYSTYKGAVTLGMIEKGTATGVAKGLAAKTGMAWGTSSTGVGTVATESTFAMGSTAGTSTAAGTTTAAGGSSAGMGAGAAGAAAYAIPIAAAVLVAVSAWNKSQRPAAENQIDEAGITPAALTGFYDGMKGIENSILGTIPTLAKYETAMYDQNTGLLVATGSVGTIALKYNEAAQAGHQWSLALGVGSDALRSNIIEAEQFSSALGVSAEGMGVAAEIAYSEAESLDVLSSALTGMGESAYSVAGTVVDAAGAIKSAYASLDSINYDDPDKHSSTASSYSGHVVNPSGYDSPNLEYHASGGVFSGATQIGRHVFGESGMEALIPLPNGFKDMADVIARLNRIEAKASEKQPIAVQVYIGNKELAGEIRVVADKVITDRQAQGNPTGSVYI